MTAAPWAGGGLERVPVLQALTALFDIGVGLALAFLSVRFWGSFRAGILAAVLYQMVPINFLAFSAGNLTNLFGVSTTVFFLTSLLALGTRPSRWKAAVAFLFSLWALTSHFSTFILALLLWPGWLGALLWFGSRGEAPEWKQTGSAKSKLLLATVLASVTAALAYYAGYLGLIGGLWHGTGIAASAAEPLSNLALRLSFFKEQLGGVFVLLALLGASRVIGKAKSNPLDATLAIWLGATAFFFVLDLTTPIGVRYALQALPLLALLAGRFLSGIMQKGKVGQIAALAALTYLCVIGLANLNDCLLARYHG